MSITSILPGNILQNRPPPAYVNYPTTNAPSFTVTPAENGYIVHIGQMNGLIGKVYVAESLDRLTDLIKEITVTSRMCGNQSGE